jgi:hypothetical protein
MTSQPICPLSVYLSRSVARHQTIDGADRRGVALAAQVGGHLAPPVHALRAAHGRPERIGEGGVDANRTRTTPRSIKPLLDHLAVSGTVSLLDHSVQDWLARLPAAASTTSPRAFLGYAIDCLLDVRDGTGWDSEYPCDVWLLRRLGVAAGHGARLDFTPVQPRWLRELAKRWCRWRISCGIGLGQLRKDLIAVVRLSRLTPGFEASTGPAALDRAALETYLAQLAVSVPHAKTRSSDISSVTGLLRAVRQHRWARLPAERNCIPVTIPAAPKRQRHARSPSSS